MYYNLEKREKKYEIFLRESLKDGDYDYLKSIIVKKQSKSDCEQVWRYS